MGYASGQLESLQQSIGELWGWTPFLQATLYLLLFSSLAGGAFYLMNRLRERVRRGHGPWREQVLWAMPLLKLMTLLFYSVAMIRIAVFKTNPMLLWVVLFALALSLGLSASNPLRNLLAGLMLTLQQPFKTGDHIRLAATAGGHPLEGRVLHIGLLSTTLKPSDGTRVEVPNRHFIDRAVVNASSSFGPLPLSIRLRVPEGVSPREAREVALHAAFLSRFTCAGHTPDVVVEDLDGAELYLKLRTCTFDPKLEGALRNDLLEIFYEHFERAAPPLNEAEPA